MSLLFLFAVIALLAVSVQHPKRGQKSTRYLHILFSKKKSIDFPSNQTYYTHPIHYSSSLSYPRPRSLQDIPSVYIYSDPENQVKPTTKLNILSLVISLTCVLWAKVREVSLQQQWAFLICRISTSQQDVNQSNEHERIHSMRDRGTSCVVPRQLL